MADSGDGAAGNGRRVSREASVDYLTDLIAELAQMARRYDEAPMAILLEAIIAARRAQPEGPSA